MGDAEPDGRRHLPRRHAGPLRADVTDKPRVVVVDDDDSVRRALERLLRSVGYDVELFGSSRAFVERGEYERADCLVLDVRMPGQSGLDVQRLLISAGHDVPIIFITGHGDIPMAAQALKAGAVDILAKPFDDGIFLKAVEQCVA
ncbi:MAG: DNA-binding response regulator, partial [Candidatus Rokuibacteriota bacterium]